MKVLGFWIHIVSLQALTNGGVSPAAFVSLWDRVLLYCSVHTRLKLSGILLCLSLACWEYKFVPTCPAYMTILWFRIICMANQLFLGRCQVTIHTWEHIFLKGAPCSDLELLLAVPNNVAKKPLGIYLSWPQTLNCSQKMPTFIHWENSKLQRESCSLKMFILRGLEIQNQIYFQKMCISLTWGWCFLNHSAGEDKETQSKDRTKGNQGCSGNEMCLAYFSRPTLQICVTECCNT